MQYITGKHALNIPCSLDTSGDWHAAALKWENITIRESDESFFGNYGIESNKRIPNNEGTYFVANHIRALLDLLCEGNFATAYGMNNDFICNPKYDAEIFSLVITMKCLPLWNDIDNFMGREYKLKWLNFKETFKNG